MFLDTAPTISKGLRRETPAACGTLIVRSGQAVNYAQVLMMTLAGFGKLANVFLCLLCALTASALVLDDQPLNGISTPSKFAAIITPELSYTPKM